MKCPKCSYTSFDYLNACARCDADLRDVRTLLQIIAVSPEELAPAARQPLEPAGMAAVREEPEEPEELSFDDLSFDSSFDDLVEHTSYAENKAPPSASSPKADEDDILDLDFGDIFGDKSSASKS